jgi:hypothetical protein
MLNRESSHDAVAAVHDMRDHAFTISASRLGLTPTAVRPRVWGTLVELRLRDVITTLVVFADGTTSLYASDGADIVDVGSGELVHTTSHQLLSTAQVSASRFATVQATPPPHNGRVKFYLKTFDGTLGADADESDLVGGRHPLSSLFYAAHAVIAAVRASAPASSRGPTAA